MAARYELQRTRDGRQFYWNLNAVNGETILTSETYVNKQGALEGIASCRVHSPFDFNYVKTNNGSQWWFVLRAANHERIGKSEMYATSQGCDGGIRSCQTNGPTAPTVDLT